MEFGAGKKMRWMPIHGSAQHLVKQKCSALLYWYAFTGCDTASFFNGRGKIMPGMCRKDFLK